MRTFVKSVDCLVKYKGKVFIYTFNQTSRFFPAGRQLRPPGIEIEATAK